MNSCSGIKDAKEQRWQQINTEETLTAIQTTLTADGTATRGFVKCFWASKNPSAELYKTSQIVDSKHVSFKVSGNLIKNPPPSIAFFLVKPILPAFHIQSKSCEKWIHRTIILKANSLEQMLHHGGWLLGATVVLLEFSKLLQLAQSSTWDIEESNLLLQRNEIGRVKIQSITV